MMEVRQLKPRKIGQQPKKNMQKERPKHGSLQSLDKQSYCCNTTRNTEDRIINKNAIRPKFNSAAIFSSNVYQLKNKQKKIQILNNYQSFNKLPNHLNINASVEFTSIKPINQLQNLYSTTSRLAMSQQPIFYFKKQQPGHSKNCISQLERTNKNLEFKLQNQKKLQIKIQKLEKLILDNSKLIQELSNNSIRKDYLFSRYVQKDDFQRVFNDFSEAFQKIDKHNQLQSEINYSNQCKFAAISRKLLKYRSQVHEQARRQSGIFSLIGAIHSSFVCQQQQSKLQRIQKLQQDESYLKIINQSIYALKQELLKQIQTFKSRFEKQIKQNLNYKVSLNFNSKRQEENQNNNSSLSINSNNINLRSLELSQSLQYPRKTESFDQSANQKSKEYHTTKTTDYSVQKPNRNKIQEIKQSMNQRNEFQCNLNTQQSERLADAQVEFALSQHQPQQNTNFSHDKQKTDKRLIVDSKQKQLQVHKKIDCQINFKERFLLQSKDLTAQHLDCGCQDNQNCFQCQAPMQKLRLDQPHFWQQMTYLIDQTGYLCDQFGRMIQDSHRKPIRISQAQIQKLQQANILQKYNHSTEQCQQTSNKGPIKQELNIPNQEIAKQISL